MKFPIPFRKTPGKSEEVRPRESLLDAAFLRRLESLSLASRRTSTGRGRGERRGKKRGSGVEFCDHRPYVPGDDIKNLDWLALERHDRLILRLYEEEEDARTDVILDASASMALDPHKWLTARKVAAALGFVALTSLDRVYVHAFRDGRLESLGPLRGRGKLLRLLRFLEPLEASGSTRLVELGSLLGRRAEARGSSYLVSDFLDPEGVAPVVEALHLRGFAPTLIELKEAKFIEEGFRGELELVDVETGASRLVALDDRERARLGERVRLREHELRAAALRRGLVHVKLDGSASFDELSLVLLQRGGVFG